MIFLQNIYSLIFRTASYLQRETLIKLVEESGIEHIKNTKLKSVMWENIAKDFQTKTGKVITGRAIMVKWHNFKYNVSTGKVSNLNDVKTQTNSKKTKSEAFDENVLVPDTILEYDNGETINENSDFGIKAEVSDENIHVQDTNLQYVNRSKL